METQEALGYVKMETEAGRQMPKCKGLIRLSWVLILHIKSPSTFHNLTVI